MASNSASKIKTDPCDEDDYVDKKSINNSVSLMSRMEINDSKAGMEGLDKEKINQIILDSSKGSKFYEMEKKKEEQLNLRIERLKSYASQISNEKMKEGEIQADLLLDKLRLERDVSHTIVHVDMDAFYAAVEMRDDPGLKSKPMAVGGMDMLCTSNYLARRFGVRAAMPGFIGLKLCPDLVIVEQNFDKYTSVSHEIRNILSLYDPNFCPMSLDEAYLDFGRHMEYRATSLVTERTFILRQVEEMQYIEANESQNLMDLCQCDLNNVLLPLILNLAIVVSLIIDEQQYKLYINNFNLKNVEEISTDCTVCKNRFPLFTLKLYGLTVEDAVLEMRNRIEQRTHLTASAGLSPNMMLSKICSDKKKPNGQFTILPDIAQIEAFIQDLPIRKVSGIGKVTEKLLRGLDVVKCRDIYGKRALLYHLFSPTSFHHFFRIFLGMGSTTVERDDERKSISMEETFSETSDPETLCSKCEEMCHSVADDMKKENIKGKTVTVKLKTITFEVKTRSQTLPDSTSDSSVIFHSAKKLLMTEFKSSQPAPLRLRLMGVRVSKLSYQNSEQLTVSKMFHKYKGKEMVPSQNRNKSDGATSSANLHDDPLIQEDGDEEDFSQPVTYDASNLGHSQPAQRGSNSTSSQSSVIIPNKPKKYTDTRRDYSASLNIRSFFTRQQNLKGDSDSQASQSDSSHPSAIGIGDCSREFQQQRTSGDAINCSATATSGLCVRPSNHSGNVEEASSSTCHLMTCPICGETNPTWDVSSLNCHIDTCLSQQTIRDILHEERQLKGSKRHREEDAKPLTPTQHTAPKSRKIQRSVLSFFQQ